MAAMRRTSVFTALFAPLDRDYRLRNPRRGRSHVIHQQEIETDWRRRAPDPYRLATPVDRVVHHGNGPLLPPAHLRLYYYRSWDPRAFTRVCDMVRLDLTRRGVRPEHRALDIGSGIGELAIG
jgi:hypothetical protein